MAKKSVQPEPDLLELYSRLGTLLIVTDNRDLRRQLQSLLGKQWRIITATDGRQALTRLAAHA